MMPTGKISAKIEQQLFAEKRIQIGRKSINGYLSIIR
jgi:hypothetical protein